MIFPVGILPLHNTAHMRAGGGYSNNFSLVFIILIAIIEYDIANDRICGKADCTISQLGECGHEVPGSGDAPKAGRVAAIHCQPGQVVGTPAAMS